MTHEEQLRSTFMATEFNPVTAEDACRRLMAIYASSNSAEAIDVGEIGEILSMAIESFHGLKEFSDGLIESGEDMDNFTIDMRDIPAEQRTAVTAVVCNMAMVGVNAEFNQGFDWTDIDSLASSAKKALSYLDYGSAEFTNNI